MKRLLVALAVLALGVLIGLALEATVGKWPTVVIIVVAALIGLYIASRKEE